MGEAPSMYVKQVVGAGELPTSQKRKNSCLVVGRGRRSQLLGSHLHRPDREGQVVARARPERVAEGANQRV